MIYLRQSTASQEVPLGYFLDSTDGNTEETALTIANTDIKVWKTGATTLANKNSGGATHISNGIYYAVLDATDTDTIGPLVVFVHVSGALSVRLECCVLDEAVYDVMFGTTAISTYAGGDTSGTTTLLSRLGTPSNLGGGATISANLVDIESQTDDIGAAGAGLTAVPWNAAWDAEVESEVNDALVVHRLDELINADSDIDGAAPPTVGSVFHELMTKTAGSFTYDQTTDSLEAVRDRGDAAWVGLDAAGTRTAVGLASANLDTQLSAIDDFLDTEIAAIKAKTDQLTFTTANQVDATTVTNSDKSGYSLAADIRIKKNTALANFTFLMVDSSDAPVAGATVTAQRSLDGGALAAMANSVVEISNGLYKINLAAADTNADICCYRFTAAGCKDRVVAFPTQTE